MGTYIFYYRGVIEFIKGSGNGSGVFILYVLQMGEIGERGVGE